MPVESTLILASGPLDAVVQATRAEAVAVPMYPGEEGVEPYAGARELLPAGLQAFLAAEKVTGSAGEVLAVPVPVNDPAVGPAVGSATGSATGSVRRLLLAGIGDATPVALRRAGAAVARRLKGCASAVVTLGEDTGGSQLAAFAEGLLLASYTFTLASAGSTTPPGEIHLVAGDPEASRAAIDRADAVARAVALARDLVNTPATDKSPAWLAGQAAGLAEGSGLAVTVHESQELAAGGFGGLIAVGQGSSRPPHLVELDYHPVGASGHVVIAGKGITFDSGGLSLKPNDNMKLMKTDMAGAAAVIGTMSALAGVGARCRVTGLVAAAENLPSGSAQRPGDVITHYGGRTVEVLNTDAEGRLVLADTLAYAARRLAPDTIIDLATLTGAATVALGRTHGALYASDDHLAAELVAAGQASGDKLWRMPLVDEYLEGLDSGVADLANVAPADYGAGSIVAALFLREFAGATPWAHLDIAGPARANGDDGEITKGGTGFGVRLLLEYLSGA